MTNKITKEPASAEAERVLSELAPIRELLDEVRTYPLKLLRLISDQFAVRGGPVPDHVLHLQPYLGETALRALIKGGYLEQKDQTHLAIHAYVPTESGLALVGGKPPAKRAASKKVKALRPEASSAQ